MPAHAINESKAKIAARITGRVLNTGSHIFEAALSPITTMGNVRRALMAEAYGMATIAQLDLIATDIEMLDALMQSIAGDEVIMPSQHRHIEIAGFILAPWSD